MGMVYSWKPEARVKIDAQVAGEEMERLRTFNNGRLTNEAVVEAARPEEAPLHDHFEWNDAVAAEAYRSEQAGYLIRSIVVDVSGEGDPSKSIRAFVSVKREDDRSYTSVQHALSDAELRAQVVAAAWAELEAWRKRHAELLEFANVFAVIEQARAA